jgi:hypothetical protein
MEQKPPLQTERTSRLAVGQGHPHHSDAPVNISNPEPVDPYNQEARGFTETAYVNRCADLSDSTGRVRHALENLFKTRQTRKKQDYEPTAVEPLESDTTNHGKHGGGVADRHYLGPSPVPIAKPKSR